MIKSLPPQDVLRQLLDYDPETGALTRKATGKPAFTSKSKAGYRKGRVLGQMAYAHRVIWKLAHGDEPPQIDHRNGDRADNRIANLRASSASGNARNAALRRDNTTGFCGVTFNKAAGMFRAYIKLDGTQVHLGYFGTSDEAMAERVRVQASHGFSERHGTAP